MPMSPHRSTIAGAAIALALTMSGGPARAQDNDQNIIHNQSNPWVSQSGPQADMARIGSFVDEASSHLPLPARQEVSGHRDLTAFVWLPHGFRMSASLPIAILSGKIGTSPASYQTLAGHLASHGIVVIVPDHNDDSQAADAGVTTQKRIDDIHDVIRSLPAIAQNAGFMTGAGIACIGFDAGITDCLMNGGIHHEIGSLHPWGGQFSSILGVEPTSKNIPEEVASINTPIMFVGAMSDMSIGNGILARHPESAPNSRVLAAIQNFSDPYVTINRPDQSETYFWRSLVTLWLEGTIGGKPEILKGLDSYGSMTANFIQTATR